MVMMAREMEIRAEGYAEGRAEILREDAARVSREFGIPLEKAKEILAGEKTEKVGTGIGNGPEA